MTTKAVPFTALSAASRVWYRRGRCAVLSCFFLLFTILALDAQAERVIDVVKTGPTKSPIDISRLRVGGTSAGASFKTVLQSDLSRSGWFEIAPLARASFVVSGHCNESGRDLTVTCHVSNTATGKNYLSKAFKGSSSDPRRLAHRVSDAIVRAVKGHPGFASTRIVMVGTASGSKEIYVCDADGKNMTRITNDGSISLAPSWTPDASSVVYTSFRATFPYVYMLNLATDPPKRRRLTSFPGLNMSAAVSPNGRSIAMSLSKDGNPELYSVGMRSGKLTRITKTRGAAEASPSWSPDGNQLVFVSDSSGRPNLYIVGRRGGDPRRITFHGTENVGPDWGPGGLIAYASRRGGRYQICVLDPKTGEERQITNDPVDHEDPSWAPDGRHVVFSRTERYRSHVYIVDTAGDSLIRLTSGRGDWYSPDWSSDWSAR